MITTTQKRKILTRMSELEHDIEALKKCRLEIATAGYASATLSSTGGTKSYTRLDLTKITEAISALTSELVQLRSMLGDTQQGIWQNVYVIYS